MRRESRGGDQRGLALSVEAVVILPVLVIYAVAEWLVGLVVPTPAGELVIRT